MMRVFFLTFLLVTLTVLNGCSEEKEELEQLTPNDVVQSYIEYWQNQNFHEMYEMLTNESHQQFSPEQFIDRYQKIYNELQIQDLTISYKELAANQIRTIMDNEEKTVTIPFTVEMKSLAGPITYNYELTFQRILEGEEKVNWYVDWNPGHIFPDLKDGGEVRVTYPKPERGRILDRNQIPLAYNDEVWNIGIIPEKLGPNPEYSKQQIANLLNTSVESINHYLNASWVEPNLFVPINKQIPKSEEKLLDQLWQIDGTAGQTAIGRVYPFNEATAHLVGYIGQVTEEELQTLDSELYEPTDMIGKTGLEYHWEERLKGKEGIRVSIVKEEEEVVLAEKEVQHGENIMTTINIDIQEALFESFEEEAGTAAAIHPKTGETLALVNSPSYNPNEMVYGISQAKWNQLQNDPQTPLLNRFTATYAPGSTIKPIVAAIGLENGTIHPDEEVEIEGFTWDNDGAWGDYAVRRVTAISGPVNVKNSLIHSDNIYYAMKAIEMGADGFIRGLENYGFGKELSFDYPIQPSTISVNGTLEDGSMLLANTSYGQGELEMSALHLAAAYTPFFNSGTMIQPILQMGEEHGQALYENLLTKEQAKVIQDALRQVVTEGTAGYARTVDFPISGKTGTAELKLTADEEDGAENGWFVGYTTEDQDLLIAMMMENVQDKGSSSLVVEKVTDVMQMIKENTIN